MKSIVMHCPLLFLLVAGASGQEALVGSWAGGSDLFPSRPGFMQARFTTMAGRITGSVSVPGWDAAKRRAVVHPLSGDSVRIEFPSAAGTPFVATGRVSGDVFSGRIERGSDHGTVHLVRVHDIAAAQLDQPVGMYEVDGESPQLVTWGAFGNLRLVSLNDAYGDALLPMADGSFFMGRSVVADTVADETVVFNKELDGTVSGFTLTRAGQPAVTAHRVTRYRQERITFANKSVRLAGTLLLPATRGRHAAVVFVHGSQDRGRDDAYDFSAAAFYLDRGVAVLVYDKRGVGQSSGDWHVASFDDLAGDALAGIHALQRRPDINPRQVGLQGVSQGGWIAPLAASKSRDVAFVVAISAAGVSPADQVRYDQMRQIRADSNISPQDYAVADSFIRVLYASLHDRAQLANFARQLPVARTRPWFRYTIAGIPASSWIWESSRRTANFDPIHVLERVRCPMLLLFGELDPNYPARESATAMQRALARAGNRDVTSWIAPAANHSLRVRTADGRWIAAPGLEQVQHEWIVAHMNVDF